MPNRNDRLNVLFLVSAQGDRYLAWTTRYLGSDTVGYHHLAANQSEFAAITRGSGSMQNFVGKWDLALVDDGFFALAGASARPLRLA
jgi:hypothetical protein